MAATPLREPGDDDARTALTHSRLLGARIYLHSYVRLAFALVVIFGALFAKHVIGIEALEMPWFLVLGLAIAAYDAAAFLLSRRHRAPLRSAAEHHRLVIVMYGAIVLDYLALTAAIWLVGGTRSPFVAFYLPHVALSCVLLSRRAAIGFAGLAYGLLIGLVAAEWSGVAPPRLPEGAILGTGPLDLRFAFTVVAVYGMLLALMVSLLTSYTKRVRDAERSVRRANLELERLSRMRRDFLHIALHNIQSPVGAVSMHLRNMEAGLAGPLTDKQRHSLERGLLRLDGLNHFIRNFRTLNSLESGGLGELATHVDVRRMLVELVDEQRELAAAHRHELVLDVPASLPPVLGIDRLLREATVNYITNAIKYTPDGGRIVVRATYREPTIRIEVEDNGIGISTEDRAGLFTEFTRLDRTGTPVAEVTGSGLGLSIVRRVIEHHGGRVDVESEPGRGSTFVIELRAVPSAPPPRAPALSAREPTTPSSRASTSAP